MGSGGRSAFARVVTRYGDPARQALRPGCEELAARIRRQCRRWKRGPRPKTATVERREAGVPRHGTRRASPARMVAPRKRDNNTSAPVGAPPAPLLGWVRRDRDKDNPGATCAAGTKNTALFDIVRSANPPHPEEARRAVSKDGRPPIGPHASRRSLRSLLSTRKEASARQTPSIRRRRGGRRHLAKCRRGMTAPAQAHKTAVGIEEIVEPVEEMHAGIDEGR